MGCAFSEEARRQNCLKINRQHFDEIEKYPNHIAHQKNLKIKVKSKDGTNNINALETSEYERTLFQKSLSVTMTFEFFF